MKSFTNLIPELVEKYEPPIITSIKKNTYKLSGMLVNDIPILEILLIIENNISGKL